MAAAVADKVSLLQQIGICFALIHLYWPAKCIFPKPIIQADQSSLPSAGRDSIPISLSSLGDISTFLLLWK